MLLITALITLTSVAAASDPDPLAALGAPTPHARHVPEDAGAGPAPNIGAPRAGPHAALAAGVGAAAGTAAGVVVGFAPALYFGVRGLISGEQSAALFAVLAAASFALPLFGLAAAGGAIGAGVGDGSPGAGALTALGGAAAFGAVVFGVLGVCAAVSPNFIGGYPVPVIGGAAALALAADGLVTVGLYAAGEDVAPLTAK